MYRTTQCCIFMLTWILQLFTFAAVGTTAQQLADGLGRHLFFVGLAKVSDLGKFNYTSQLLVISSMLCSKISFTWFLLKLFATTFRWRLFFYCLLATITATYLSAAILIFPQCDPVAKLWNPFLVGECWPKTTQISVYHYQGGKSHFQFMSNTRFKTSLIA